MAGKWTLLGFDTFTGDADPEGSWYRLKGSYTSEAQARAAAQVELDAIEKLQSSDDSGGQDGIQDQVSSTPRSTRYVDVGSCE